MGGGAYLMAKASAALGRRDLLPPNPKASAAQLAEADRARREIAEIIDPWMSRLGLLSIAVGVVLALVAALT